MGGVCELSDAGRAPAGGGAVGRGRVRRRLPEGERGSKMATTKRVLYVGEQARAPSRVWANRIRVGPGVGSYAEGSK